MDFETSKSGGNPFLMEDYSATTTAGGGGGVSSNPFLSGFDMPSSSVASDNPFLSGDTAVSSPFLLDSSGDGGGNGDGISSTNPFAQFSSAGETQSYNHVDFFGTGNSEPAETSNDYSNLFGSVEEDKSLPATHAVDFFSSAPSVPVGGAAAPGPPPRPAAPPQIADFLDDDSAQVSDFCKETSDIFAGVTVDESIGSCPPSSRTSTPSKGAPRRPPPPRPVPPRETKELILSVTGAMEATSSHLLDRLKATRTPSPTPIRDLHSPSPTPELLDNLDLLGDEVLGDPADVAPALPHRPPPPARPDRPPVPTASDSDFMDIFGTETTTSAPVANSNTTTDMLGLFDTDVPMQNAPLDNVTQATDASNFLLDSDFVTNNNNILESSETNDFGSLAGMVPCTETQEQEAVSFLASPVQPTTEYQPIAATTSVQEDQQWATETVSGDQWNVTSAPAVNGDIFCQSAEPSVAATAPVVIDDAFDAFAAKFESAGDSLVSQVGAAERFGASEGTSSDPFDPFGAGSGVTAMDTSADVWGSSTDSGFQQPISGFGAEESFDAFLSLNEPPPPPQGTPARINREESADSDEAPDFSIFIRPKIAATDGTPFTNDIAPQLAPPPKSPVSQVVTQEISRFNPFDKSNEIAAAAVAGEEPALPQGAEVPDGMLQRTDSQETPPTPLFDDDVSQPLEDFPRILYDGDGWEMHLRQPNKKKITGQRFWKKVFVRLVMQGDNPILQLYNTREDKDPFQELPLQACYSVSDIGAQQFDAYGKIFTVKLQYVFYKERPGVRPGQVTKAERLTTRISQFAHHAIQGDYQGCKEFGSDLRKLGLPVEHAPQISQLFKIGSQTFEDIKQFSVSVEESLFKLPAHRDRALNYKTEEVQITAVDELYVDQDSNGHVERQIARVRLFFLGFLAGMPDVELGVNDLWRQGKEVVGRHDIIPVITEEWIRLEGVEFHSCVQQDEYERTRVIKFKPPDACYIELMRFRVRPPKNRELPLQVKAVICVTGNKVEIKSEILVPGFSSRKLGQIPCEDVMVRFPIPECWIYLFRVEKHFRYGSVKSTHRRTGKVKGIERFLGTVETLEQSLIEVTSGQAKYEHQHRAIVWRMARLPKEGQGAYTTHSFVCRLGLTSYDQIPEQLAEYCYVEFTMPATQVSHTTVRSVSLSNGAKDDPPEKYVRYLARHEYRVGIEHTQGEGPGAYVSATLTSNRTADIEEKPEPPPPPPSETPAADSDSDSSS